MQSGLHTRVCNLRAILAPKRGEQPKICNFEKVSTPFDRRFLDQHIFQFHITMDGLQNPEAQNFKHLIFYFPNMSIAEHTTCTSFACKKDRAAHIWSNASMNPPKSSISCSTTSSMVPRSQYSITMQTKSWNSGASVLVE